jgi:glycolate oxidase iron-sulfur subunit
MTDRRIDGRTGANLPSVRPSVGPSLFRGCVQNGLFDHVHEATLIACEKNGIPLGEVSDQVCCGALAAHAGEEHLSRSLARENITAFSEGSGTIVVNSAGCGAMMKAYGDLLAGTADEQAARAFSARVRDVSEVLAERGPVAGTNAVPLRVAYDAPCHLVHAQKISQPPLRVLAAVPGLELVPLEGGDRCCGSAGLYSMIEPAMSQAVLEKKLQAIAAAAPDVVATGNPGCIMQIGAGVILEGLDIGVCHPVELLARSYAGTPGR